MSLGERDAFPITEARMRRTIEMIGAHQSPRLGEWSPWRALAATHLWVAEPTYRSWLATA